MTTIDTAKPQDSQQITEIFHQYNEIKQEFTLPTKKDEEKYISDVINQKDAVLLKAQINEKIVGYLILYIQSYPKAFFVDTQKGFIGSIGVDENYRGQGIGKMLLTFAENYLKERNIFVFDTDVYTFNTSAEKLYEEFGFENIRYYKRKFLK